MNNHTNSRCSASLEDDVPVWFADLLTKMKCLLLQLLPSLRVYYAFKSPWYLLLFAPIIHHYHVYHIITSTSQYLTSRSQHQFYISPNPIIYSSSASSKAGCFSDFSSSSVTSTGSSTPLTSFANLSKKAETGFANHLPPPHSNHDK